MSSFFLSFFSALKVCFESLQNVFASSDNQFSFKRGLSYSHAIYTEKCVVNKYWWHFVRILLPRPLSLIVQIWVSETTNNKNYMFCIPSVHLSHAGIVTKNQAKITGFSPSDSPTILVFCKERIILKFRMWTL